MSVMVIMQRLNTKYTANKQGKRLYYVMFLCVCSSSYI